MKKLIFFTIITVLSFSTNLQAADTVRIEEPQLPILIDRHDNILFRIRIDSKNNDVFNQLSLSFGADVTTANIKSVKLYYSGTEAVQRAGQIYYAPVEYIARDIQGKTRVANPSYSILKNEVENPTHQVSLKANQTLFKGINYFWVSIQMQTNTPLATKLNAKVNTVLINNQPASINLSSKSTERYVGVGVRHAGDNGVEAYRIPGLATSNKGTLLAVYDIRYNSGTDLQEYVDVGLSRSTNGGQTWEPMRTIMNFGEYGGLPKAQNGVGDPAILVDKVTNTIWVAAAWTHGMGNGRAWFNSGQGMDTDETAQLVLSKSDDDGKTWSQPINITKQLKAPSSYFLLQGPGNGITMQDGTLVFATQFIDSTRIPNAGIMYSKDRGKTWHMHNYAQTNTTEAQVVETDYGTLMLNMRDNRGGSRAIATTKDLGKTWTEHSSSRNALQESVCMASLIKVAAKDNILNKDILLFSNPNTKKGRHSITIKASLDNGVTWLSENQLLVDEGNGWGYSCLSMVDKETVGIFYESSVAHMTFQAIKLTDILK